MSDFQVGDLPQKLLSVVVLEIDCVFALVVEIEVLVLLLHFLGCVDDYLAVCVFNSIFNQKAKDKLEELGSPCSGLQTHYLVGLNQLFDSLSVCY